MNTGGLGQVELKDLAISSLPPPPAEAGDETRKTLGPRSVERGGRVELDARTHGRTQRHLLDEGALGAARLGAADRAHQGLDVGGDRVLAERSLADTSMNDASLLGAELDRAGLGGLHGRRDVLRAD